VGSRGVEDGGGVEGEVGVFDGVRLGRMGRLVGHDSDDIYMSGGVVWDFEFAGFDYQVYQSKSYIVQRLCKMVSAGFCGKCFIQQQICPHHQ
jgi:hypothetical protein